MVAAEFGCIRSREQDAEPKPAQHHDGQGGGGDCKIHLREERAHWDFLGPYAWVSIVGDGASEASKAGSSTPSTTHVRKCKSNGLRWISAR